MNTPSFRETTETREMRYVAIAGLAFWLYWYYSSSGLRTRYILWHLERIRYGSGFIPLETAAVAAYHSVILCLGSESLLLLRNSETPSWFELFWFQNLGIRMKNVFFFSILQHIILERSGFFDRVRLIYFDTHED
jgi:hypothetical protein